MPRRSKGGPSADEITDSVTSCSGTQVLGAATVQDDDKPWFGNFPAGVRDLSESDLQLQEEQPVIGKGSESTVYLGKLGGPGGQNVAVKAVRIRGYDDLVRFKREMAILDALAPHECVACLIGVDPTPGKRALVLPYMENGDLGTVIHDRGVKLGNALALCYSLQVADGLAHVHSRGFVHKDVKSANVLVSGDWKNVVLSDFGLADRAPAEGLTDSQERAAIIRGNRGPTGGVQRVRMVGTLVSLAPEVLGNRPHSQSSDVYSWAVLANELLASAVPYSDRLMGDPKPHTILDATFNQAELMQAIASGLRPVLSPEAPAWATNLIQGAWGGDAKLRPGAAQCGEVLRLQGVAREMSCLCPQFPGELQGGDAVVPVAAEAEGSARKGEAVVMSWTPAIKCGAATFLTAGRRGPDKMEDFAVVERLGPVTLFGVFDGHGGPEVSRFAAENLKRSFLCSAGELGAGASPGDVLAAALWRLEQEVMGLPGVTSGSTALVGCLVGDVMWLANLGDCRAVSYGQDGVLRLTVDQTCSLESERTAVEARGGRVEAGRVDGKIEVSRTLGDRALKPHLGSDAEVTMHDCRGFMWTVVASDGLWEVVSDDEAMGIVRDTVKTPDLLAKRLVMHAIDPRGSMDNISCIVFVFGDLEGAIEKIY